MSNIRDEQIKEYAGKFKALSNPNRLKIFLRLVSMCCQTVTEDELEKEVNGKAAIKGCACVGDIGQFLGIVPSTISHHLKELRQALPQFQIFIKQYIQEVILQAGKPSPESHFIV